MNTVKVLGVGSPILDLLVNVDDAFIDSIQGEKGGMELVRSNELDATLKKSGKEPLKTLGGSAANTIFGLTKLGMQTAFLGMLGDDEDGYFYKNEYDKMGGDTSRFLSTSSCHHGRCLSLVTPDSQRTMRTDLGAAATLSPDAITIDAFNDIQHVHIEGYIIFNEPLTRHVLKLAKQAGCSVSLDLASFEVVNATRAILPSLLENVDIVFANEDEGAAFCDSDDQDVAIELLSRYCDIAVLKLGKEGSIIAKDGKKVQIKPELATAIDTTGAGDLWQAGFLYGVLNELPLEKAGAYGSILGAEVVQVMGAVIPDDTWTKIKTKIETI